MESSLPLRSHMHFVPWKVHRERVRAEGLRYRPWPQERPHQQDEGPGEGDKNSGVVHAWSTERSRELMA